MALPFLRPYLNALQVSVAVANEVANECLAGFFCPKAVSLLESVCCKKRQKIVPGLGNKGPLKVLNGTKLILDDHGNNLDSFT